MNTSFPLKRSLLLCGLLLGATAPWAWSQQPNPTPPSSSLCPTLGWSEGLAGNFLGPAAAFPTQDTAGNPSDCAFHQWSWEAFVWATAIDPATKRPRFLGLPSLDDLGKSSVAAAEATPRFVLKPRKQKPVHSEKTLTTAAGQEIPDVDQAQTGILVDQNGQALYYSEHANATYFNFAQKYYGIAKFDAAPAKLNFPVGSAVFKASWRIVGASEDASSASFTMPASVPKLINTPNGVTTGKEMRQVTVALVGLHVVGVTVNHPEFIWGTFEQVNNAPDLPPGLAHTQPVSNQSFTIYKAGTPVNQCNILSGGKGGPPLKLDEATQTLTPINNVFRRFSHGGANAAQAQEIDSINTGAQGAAKSFPNGGSVWANYKLIGTLWIKANTLQPDVGGSKLFGQGIGSVTLANATMETFVQQSGMSCFSCHNTGASAKTPSGHKMPGKNIGLSHALGGPFFTAPSTK